MHLAVLTSRRSNRWMRRIVPALLAEHVDVRSGTERAQAQAVLDLRPAYEREDCAAGPSWFFEVGGERAGMPAFEEASTSAQYVHVALIERTRDGELLVRRSGRFPYASRYARTMQRIVRLAARWVREELAIPSPDAAALAGESRPVQRNVTLADWLKFAWHEARRIVVHALRFTFEEICWDVAVTNRSVDDFISDPRNAWLHWFARGKREFLADPFITRGHDGAPRILCETVAAGAPSIVSIDLDDRYGERSPVDIGAGAASYPHVVDVDGEVWMTPEQHRRRSVRAYHLNGSVRELSAPILDGIAAVDPTIVSYEGRWWLFCTDEDDGPNYALRIFWSESPHGPWHAHARNPAKIDVAGARPAGNFFVRDGILHRPAQDCRGRYGRAIAIQRIDVLTPYAFSETCVARINASSLQRPGAIGTHTLSHGEGWVAIDAQFARWSLRKPLRRLFSR